MNNDGDKEKGLLGAEESSDDWLEILTQSQEENTHVFLDKLMDAIFPDQDDPEADRALSLAEVLARRRIFPERYEGQDFREYEEELQDIYANRASNGMEKRRQQERDFRDRLANFAPLAKAGQLSSPEFVVIFREAVSRYGDPNCAGILGDNQAVSLSAVRREILKDAMFVHCLDFLEAFLGSESSVEIARRFVSSERGNASGNVRSAPKKLFQDWARDVLNKVPGTSIGSLPEKYIRTTGSTISILTLRKYLTPSGGFNPKG